jgi:hypothetical protein
VVGFLAGRVVGFLVGRRLGFRIAREVGFLVGTEVFNCRGVKNDLKAVKLMLPKPVMGSQPTIGTHHQVGKAT